jgi:hypothetical protein
MSGRPPRPPPKHVPEPEPEEDEEFDEDEEMGEFDGIDILSSLLATEEGETVAQALVSIKEATEKIALNMEMQNKILVKIVTALNKAPAPVQPPTDA